MLGEVRGQQVYPVLSEISSGYFFPFKRHGVLIQPSENRGPFLRRSVPEYSCDLGDDVACSDCCGYLVEHAKITFGYKWLARTQNSTTRTRVDGSTRKSSHRISEN